MICDNGGVITFTDTVARDIATLALSAGRMVGSREARRADLYLTVGDVEVPGADDTVRDTKPVLAFGSSPHPYAWLLGSVRWSVSKSDYVVTVNDLLGPEATLEYTAPGAEAPGKGRFADLFGFGLAEGKAAWEASQAAAPTESTDDEETEG